MRCSIEPENITRKNRDFRQYQPGNLAWSGFSYGLQAALPAVAVAPVVNLAPAPAVSEIT